MNVCSVFWKHRVHNSSASYSLISLHILAYWSLFCHLSSSTVQPELISLALSPHHSSSCPPHRIPVRAGPTVRSLVVGGTSTAAIKEISVATRPASCRTRLSVTLTIVVFFSILLQNSCALAVQFHKHLFWYLGLQVKTSVGTFALRTNWLQ